MAGGDPFKKATPGQKLRIPAAAYNAFIDSALDFQRRQRDQRGKSRGRPGDESCLVLVCNSSGSDLARFAVVTVSGIAISPADNLGEFQDGPVLKVAAPVEDGPVAILQEPIPAGQYGKALVVGLTAAYVHVEDGEHLFCRAVPGDTAKLQTDTTGPIRLMWRPVSLGNQWCVVALGHAAGAEDLLHPWKVTVDGTGEGATYSITGGRVWTREGNKLEVSGFEDSEIAGTCTVVCKVTIPTSTGGTVTPTAEIVDVAGAVDYWEHSSATGVVKRFPLAIIIVGSGGHPSVAQVRFCDIDAGAGTSVNDDATSKLWDGTTEFLVLTEEGEAGSGSGSGSGAGSAAAAKVRKLTVQIDHGRVIRWEWSTPQAPIGFTDPALKVYGEIRWNDETHVIEQHYWSERWENGVRLEIIDDDQWEAKVSFVEFACPEEGS